MEKDLSSVKILNVIFCVVLLVAFCVSTRTIVKADSVSVDSDELYSESSINE